MMEWPSPEEDRSGLFRHPSTRALSTPQWFLHILTAKHSDQLSKLSRVNSICRYRAGRSLIHPCSEDALTVKVET